MKIGGFGYETTHTYPHIHTHTHTALHIHSTHTHTYTLHTYTQHTHTHTHREFNSLSFIWAEFGAFVFSLIIKPTGLLSITLILPYFSDCEKDHISQKIIRNVFGNFVVICLGKFYLICSGKFYLISLGK